MNLMLSDVSRLSQSLNKYQKLPFICYDNRKEFAWLNYGNDSFVNQIITIHRYLQGNHQYIGILVWRSFYVIRVAFKILHRVFTWYLYFLQAIIHRVMVQTEVLFIYLLIRKQIKVRYDRNYNHYIEMCMLTYSSGSGQYVIQTLYLGNSLQLESVRWQKDPFSCFEIKMSSGNFTSGFLPICLQVSFLSSIPIVFTYNGR